MYILFVKFKEIGCFLGYFSFCVPLLCSLAHFYFISLHLISLVRAFGVRDNFSFLSRAHSLTPGVKWCVKMCTIYRMPDLLKAAWWAGGRWAVGGGWWIGMGSIWTELSRLAERVWAWNGTVGLSVCGINSQHTLSSASGFDSCTCHLVSHPLSPLPTHFRWLLGPCQRVSLGVINVLATLMGHPFIQHV